MARASLRAHPTSPMPIRAFDHVAIPTSRPLEMLAFYAALGFSVPEAEAWKESGVPFFSIQFGANKINVHAPELWQSESFGLRGPTAVLHPNDRGRSGNQP